MNKKLISITLPEYDIVKAFNEAKNKVENEGINVSVKHGIMLFYNLRLIETSVNIDNYGGDNDFIYTFEYTEGHQ